MTRNVLMVIPGENDKPTRYATRTSEMVRTLGTMHEYVRRQTDEDDESDENSDDDERTHLQLIEAVKWVPAVMDRPERNVPLVMFLDILRTRIELEEPESFPQYINAEIAINAVELVIRSIAKIVAGGSEHFKLTQFQSGAICDALLTSWTGAHQPVVVSAGTGSGKTIAFTVPVLVDALLRNYAASQRGEEGQWSQLLAYPRNDLAFDQFSTLTSYIKEINKTISKDESSKFMNAFLTIAIDAGGMIKKYNKDIPGTRIAWDPRKEWMGPGKKNVVRASVSRYGGRNPESKSTSVRASSIIIASLESFRRRMVIPEVVQAAKSSLRRVVFDEVHLASGLEGGHIRGLFNRLRSIVNSSKRKLDFIAASATIAEPSNHISKVWGCNPEDVLTIEPSEEESKGTVGGIVNHILVRPRTGVSKGGPVYNATSLIGHQTLDLSQLPAPLDAETIKSKEIQKMICFADSKEFVGRWQMLLNENESTMNAQSISKKQIEEGKGGAITLPYANWFDRPMAQILNDDEMCNKCKGERSSTGERLPPCKMSDPPPAIRREKIFSFRTKIGGNSVAERFAMEALPQDGEEFINFNGLDECPMLKAGVCWWFSGDSDSKPLLANAKKTSPHPLQDSFQKSLVKRPNMGDAEEFVFRRTLRSRRHTADQTMKKDKDGLSTDDDQFSSNKLFEHWSGETYPPVPSAVGNFSVKIPHNVVIATPTLEVGVDIDNVNNVIMHRAMRDIASYRQKAGRAGREKNSVANVTTILSKRPQDYEFYNQHGRLIHQPIRNVVPIASLNRSVMLSQAYMCVMDFIASKEINIEEISTSDWASQLDKAIELISDSVTSSECRDWIASGFWGINTATLLPKDLRRVVNTFLQHLKILRDTKFTTKGQKVISLIDGIQIMHEPLSSFPVVDVGSQERIVGLLGKLKTLSEKNGCLTEDILDDLIDLCSNQSLSSSKLETVYNRFVDERTKLPFAKKSEVSGIGNALEELGAALEEDQPESDTASSKIAKQISKAFGDWSAKYYLSYLLSKAECFLIDAPYCFVSSILENPRERKINVSRESGTIITQTVNQAMRDLLPGTWNFRLSPQGTGHALKSPIGGNGIDRDGDYDYVILNAGEVDPSESFALGKPQRIRNLNKPVDISKIPWMLRLGFNDSERPIMVQPSFVRLTKEIGMNNPQTGKNVPSKVPFIEGTGLVSYMDRSETGVDYSLIPEAWPMRWSTYVMEEPISLRSYTPSSDGDRGNGSRDVTRHPALNGTFSTIKFTQKAEINNVVTGVRRTRGVMLKYHAKIDGKTTDVVYGDTFQSDGIEYTLDSRIVREIEENARAIQSWNFDSDVIKLLQHHIERLNIFGPKESLTIRSIVHILLIKLYEQNEESLPTTVEELIHSLSDCPIEHKDIQIYLSTVRKNIKKLFEENLEKCVPKYNEKISLIWNTIQWETSAKEWTTLTLLNTIGRGLVGAVSKFSGVQEEKISATFDLEKGTIIVYDNEPGGNGTSESVKQHYQITKSALNAQRQMGAPPPTDQDFAHVFERWLVSCEEHANHRVALLHHTEEIEKLPKDMEKYVRESENIAERFSIYWKALHIDTLRRAGILSHITPHLLLKLREKDVEVNSVDTLDQAMSLCDTGCFVCQGSNAGSSFPGLLSERYTSRNILEKYIGISVDKPGYGTPSDGRRSRGVVAGGIVEEFPHWKRSQNQIFTFAQTCIPETIGYHMLRSSDGVLPILNRLLRLHDSIIDGGDV